MGAYFLQGYTICLNRKLIIHLILIRTLVKLAYIICLVFTPIYNSKETLSLRPVHFVIKQFKRKSKFFSCNLT